MRRNLILLMVLGLSSLLQAMNYSGPVSWDPWFQKAEQHLNEFGFPIPDDLAIRDGVMVLTMDESISRAILPEPRDFSHVMPVFYTLVLDLLDPASLPLHRDATLATLLKGTSFEMGGATPEDLVLRTLYDSLIEQDLTVLGRIWVADRTNGPGRSIEAINEVLLGGGQDTIGSLFRSRALRMIDEWMPLLQPGSIHAFPLQPQIFQFDNPDPLTIRVHRWDLGRRSAEGVVLDAVTEPSGVRGSLIVRYRFPVADVDVRPLTAGIRVPLSGLEDFLMVFFNTADLPLSENSQVQLTPLERYPARVEGTKLELEGDQFQVSFRAESVQDVQSWVILKSEVVDDTLVTGLASMLPAVPHALEPMSFHLLDPSEEPTSTTYGIYALTSEGFLAPIGELRLKE